MVLCHSNRKRTDTCGVHPLCWLVSQYESKVSLNRIHVVYQALKQEGNEGVIGASAITYITHTCENAIKPITYMPTKSLFLFLGLEWPRLTLTPCLHLPGVPRAGYLFFLFASQH